MDKNELTQLDPELLAKIILDMGHIIRHLDEDNEHVEYWTQDGEYILLPLASKYLKIEKH